MRNTSIAVAVAALVLAGPVMGFAQTTATKSAASTSATSAKKTAAPAAAAVHATKGVVKSIDGSTLVISKMAGKGPETTFVVNASTQRHGTVAAGSSVDVRYKTEGKDKVATAITAQEVKMPVAKTTAAKMPADSKPKAMK